MLRKTEVITLAHIHAIDNIPGSLDMTMHINPILSIFVDVITSKVASQPLCQASSTTYLTGNITSNNSFGYIP